MIRKHFRLTPRGSVRVERFGLPAGAVEREHELAA